MPEISPRRTWLVWLAFALGFVVALLWLRRSRPETSIADSEATRPAQRHAQAAVAHTWDGGSQLSASSDDDDSHPRVELIVRDPSGAPVLTYKAEIRRNPSWAQSWRSDWPPPYLSQFHPGAYVLSIDAQHFDHFAEPLQMPLPGPIEVTLTPAQEFEISGVVLSDAPLPAGAHVRVVADEGLGEFDEVPIDDARHFVAHVPEKKTYAVTFHDERVGTAQEYVTAPKSDVELHVDALAGIRVHLAGAGPVQLNRIGVSSEECHWIDGFKSRELHDGDVLLGFEDGSWTFGFSRGPDRAEASVKLVSGQIADVWPDFATPVHVRGRIVDRDGKPLLHAMVIRPPALVRADGQFEATVDALGEPLIIQSPDDKRMTVEARSEDLGDIVFTPDEDRVPRRHVTGRVLDPQRNPVPSFAIENGLLGERTFSDGSGQFAVELEEDEPDPDDDGPPDPLELGVTAKGFLSTEVELAAGQTWVEITLTPRPSLRGRVFDPTGAPVVGAQVRCDDCEVSVETDANGEFALEKKEPGWPQRIYAESGTLSAMGLTRGEPVTLRLAPPVEVQLELPFSKGRVRVDGDDDGFGETKLVISPPGHASATLPAGVYSFGVGDDELMPATAVPGFERDEVLISGASMTVKLVPEERSVSGMAVGSTSAP